MEAAKLRQAAAVIAAVGREISSEVGQDMRIRFDNRASGLFDHLRGELSASFDGTKDRLEILFKLLFRFFQGVSCRVGI